VSGIFEFSGFDPIFVAKLIDFVIFVAALVYVYNRWIKGALVAHQEAQNRAVEEALLYRDRAEKSVEDAKGAVEKAKLDSVRMLELARAQAQRLFVDERTSAGEYAARIVAHAQGELDRERYRVRRELLEETVQRAHAAAHDIAKNELTDAQQRALIERFTNELESEGRA
jgi:F-type H+-transporting ATPase subunit b